MSTAGRMIAGAVAGVSKFGLDQIENRQEEEREVRKAKLLETLRRDTATQLATFEEKMRASRADKNFSGVDGDDFVTRDAEGREKGRRKLTVTEREEMDRDRTKSNLDIENTRSQISAREQGLALDRERVGIARTEANRRTKGSGLGEDDEVSDTDIANELMYRYSGEVEEAVKSNNISRGALRAAAIDIAANSKNGEVAQNEWVKFINNYRSGRKKTAKALDEPL